MSSGGGVRLPNFLVIGAPKCGTTSLYEYLRQHPQVFLPARKELHYFAYPALARHAEGPGDRETLAGLCRDHDAYASHYQQAARAVAVGEVSPSYLYFAREAIPRIRHTLGRVRIVVMLRNPIMKCHSQYMHLVREGRETLQFAQALDAEVWRREAGWGDLWRYCESTLYADRIRAYRRAFGADRVMVLWFEEFVRQPPEVLARLYAFLGVDSSFRVDTGGVFNRTGRPRSAALARLLSGETSLKRAARMLLPQGLRHRLRSGLTSINTGVKDPIDGPVYDRLRETFAGDVRKLGDVLGETPPWDF
jgi:hypothetical protein